MNRLIYLFILLVLLGCVNEPKKPNIKQMKIGIKIIPENNSGAYAIHWNDTLGLKFNNQGTRLENRPQELHLYILNMLENRPQELHLYILNMENDTIGFYRGLSSPRQFAYFQTTKNKDSIIDLRFSMGVNHFSTFLAKQSRKYIEEFKNRV